MGRSARRHLACTWARLWPMIEKAKGNVIIEFAFVAPVLVVLIVNILDFSSLIWDQMEVDYSAQMGAQAAYKTCSTGTMPAKSNCTNLNTQVTTAVQSSSLGTSVRDLLLHFRNSIAIGGHLS